MTTVDTTSENVLQIRVEDSIHLNILDVSKLCLDGSAVWKWSRSTLYRLLKKFEFVCHDRVTHYRYSNSREDFIKMLHHQLDWIQNYRTEGRHVYYQTKLGYSKVWHAERLRKIKFENTTDGCFTVSSGKGERSTLSQIGSPETG